MHSNFVRLLALLLLVNCIFCEALTSYAQSLFTFQTLFTTPVLHSVAMFLTVHCKQYFIENTVSSSNYWRTKCIIPNSSSLSVNATQPKTQENIRIAATLLYRTHSTVNTLLTKISYFFQYLL